MPLFELRVRAALEGAAWVRLGAGYALRVKLACTACREPSDRFSVFSWDDAAEVPGGKGAAHLVQACKTCKAPGSVSIASALEAAAPLTAADAEAGRAVAVATLECRGVVPVEAQCGPGWVVGGPSGETWADVSLDAEFCEYDEAAGVSVTVLDAAMSVAPAGGGRR
jgi:hypothetical protein